MSKVLYLEYRPKSWDAVIGQDHIVKTLRNAIVAGRIAHAYLFAGPRGTGKTTTARLLAKMVNCTNPDPAKRPCGKCDNCIAVDKGRFLDLIEIDGASTNSVDDVRDLRDKINFSPNKGEYKIYIIDEVHMLSKPAFNALLKTLEEPPSHAIFILATTEIHKIPATVLSRCQRHEFRRIPVAEIVANLEKIAQAETISFEPEALTLIARQATGSMRDAISLLDQLASGGENITLSMTQTVLGTATSQSVIQLAGALIQQQPAQGLDYIHETLDNGTDPHQFARQIVDYFRNLLLIRMGNDTYIDASSDVLDLMQQHAQAFEIPALLDIIRVFNHAAVESKATWQPALPLEMAYIGALELLAPSAPQNSRGSIDGELQEERNPKTASSNQAKASQEGGRNSTSTQKVVPARRVAESPPVTRLERQSLASPGKRKISGEMETGGLVAAALRDLGGEIVDVQKTEDLKD